MINLKKDEDILYMSHTINSIKIQYPDADISTLSFKESQKSINLLKDIQRAFFIDRNKILAFLKKIFFSDSLAINHFSSVLTAIKAIEWYAVFSYSNDRISSHIVSFLTQDTSLKYIGTRIGLYGNIEYSNHWAKMFNNFFAEHTYTPLPSLHSYTKMIPGAKMAHKLYRGPLLTNKKHDQTVGNCLSPLKKKKMKILGIVLSASTPTKSIPKNIIFELIEKLCQEEQISPILIHTSSKRDKEIVGNLTKNIKNKIIKIECDLIGAVSVIKNCDALLTPDTGLKHIADLEQVPSIEVSLGEASLFKQSSLLPSSIILSPPIHKRTFDPTQPDTISSHDIFIACNHILFNHDLRDMSDHISIYKIFYNDFGLYLKVIYGQIDVFDEITRTVLRYFIYTLFYNKVNILNENEVLRYGYGQIRDWVNIQKNEIFKRVDIILHILGLVEKYKDNTSELVQLIDLLLKSSKEFSLSGFCLSLFQGTIENLPLQSEKDNFTQFKGELRKLKKNLMMANSLIDKIESSCRQRLNLEQPHHTYQ